MTEAQNTIVRWEALDADSVFFLDFPILIAPSDFSYNHFYISSL